MPGYRRKAAQWDHLKMIAPDITQTDGTKLSF